MAQESALEPPLESSVAVAVSSQVRASVPVTSFSPFSAPSVLSIGVHSSFGPPSTAMVVFNPNQSIDPGYVPIVTPTDAEKDRLSAAVSSPSPISFHMPAQSSGEVVPSVPAVVSASIITSVMDTPVIHPSTMFDVPAVNQPSPGFGVSHQSTVIVKAGTKAANFLAFATIGPIRHPSYPDNQFSPPVHQLFFLLPLLHPRDLLLSRPLMPHSEPSQFKSWPRVLDGWVEWIDRLEPHFGRQWSHQ